MAEKLKEMFFTPSSVDAMADALKRAYPALNKKRLAALVFDDTFDAKSLRKAEIREFEDGFLVARYDV